jgi:hypothetical protein
MITANPNAAFRDVKTNRADHASEIAGSTILSRYAALELRGEKAHPASMIVRSSMLSRILHDSPRFFFALVLGIGLTLAWHSYGSQAVEIIRTQAPSLAQWLPASTGQPADAPLAAPLQQLKPTLAAADQQLSVMPPEDGSAELGQQLNAIAIDLTAVKETLDRLAADRGKITQSIDRLERGQQEMAQKLSSMAAPKPVVRAPIARPVHHSSPPSVQAPSKPLPITPPPAPME